MPEDTNRKELVAAGETGPVERDQPMAKGYVKPTLTRHQSLPRVTAGIAGGGSP